MTNQELIIACTLDPELVRERVDDWRRLVAESDGVEEVDGGLRLRFALGSTVDGARVAALAEAERDCCPFFAFTLRVDEAGSRLEITAPAEARPLVDVLLSLGGGEGA